MWKIKTKIKHEFELRIKYKRSSWMKLKGKVNKPRSEGLQTITEYLGNASIKRSTWNIN